MTCEGTCDTKRKGNGDSNSCSCVSSQCWGLGGRLVATRVPARASLH